MTHYLLVSPLPPPPISTLLPYTTPFRSPGRPSSGTPGDAEASRPLGQSRGDDAHEELTHLAGGQQGHQHGGETAGGEDGDGVLRGGGALLVVQDAIEAPPQSDKGDGHGCSPWSGTAAAARGDGSRRRWAGREIPPRPRRHVPPRVWGAARGHGVTVPAAVRVRVPPSSDMTVGTMPRTTKAGSRATPVGSTSRTPRCAARSSA